MTRDEFMKELAYLLQDIQDEDKDDAVQYYTDYFEEAGPDKEAEVIQELEALNGLPPSSVPT